MKGGVNCMEKNKIQTRILIKIISTILTTIILLQICSPIALGIKETENLQKLLEIKNEIA